MTITVEMIEAGAMALHHRVSGPSMPWAGAFLSDDDRQTYREDARAVIEAALTQQQRGQ